MSADLTTAPTHISRASDGRSVSLYWQLSDTADAFETFPMIKVWIRHDSASKEYRASITQTSAAFGHGVHRETFAFSHQTIALSRTPAPRFNRARFDAFEEAIRNSLADAPVPAAR